MFVLFWGCFFFASYPQWTTFVFFFLINIDLYWTYPVRGGDEKPRCNVRATTNAKHKNGGTECSYRGRTDARWTSVTLALRNTAALTSGGVPAPNEESTSRGMRSSSHLDTRSHFVSEICIWCTISSFFFLPRWCQKYTLQPNAFHFEDNRVLTANSHDSCAETHWINATRKSAGF